MAAAGDERYLVCAAGAAWIISTRNRFLLCVLQRVLVHVCVTLAFVDSLVAYRSVVAALMLHGL